MQIDLRPEEIDKLLECLGYSVVAVGDAEGTPEAVRRENLAFLQHLKQKLEGAKESAD
jgi:hypothetical protein